MMALCFGRLCSLAWPRRYSPANRWSRLVNASRGFSTAIQQQILAIHRGPSLIELVAKTIDYAEAKEAYFKEVLQVWRFDLISWADAPRPIDFRTIQVAPV